MKNQTLLPGVLLLACGRPELVSDQVQVLQSRIQALQEQIIDLETEAATCNTDSIRQQSLNDQCQSETLALEAELTCAAWRQEHPPNWSALGMAAGDRLTLDLDTSLGSIQCDLLPAVSPEAVLSFVQLVRGETKWTHPTSGETMSRSIYTGTLFHRVDPGFMIQGGDPIGNGTGGPGFATPDQFECTIPFTEPGLLAFAHVGRPGTAGSQFFITTGPQPGLSGRYTVLGRCQNLDVIRAIASVPRTAADRPLEDVILREARVSVLTESR